MFSRLALRPGFYLARTTPIQIRATGSVAKDEKSSGKAVATIQEGPERDLVNFPRRVRPLYPGKVRMGFVPEEWFQFFYKKTGVTGPYLFGGGLITYLLSKELWVVEHDFYAGVSLSILAILFVKKVGPSITAAIDKDLDNDEKELDGYRDNSIKRISDAIEEEKLSQWQAQGQKYLLDAKRENILLQLEADYRKRLMTVYNDVKRRLDYQIEVQNAGRRIEQRHMVKWIVDNVMKSISPQQEKEALQLCVSNLKRLAAQVPA